MVQVFPNNIMPATAAAWYMAKRRFYANQPLDLQLLAFLLKKYPDKFKVTKLKVGVFISLDLQLLALRLEQFS